MTRHILVTGGAGYIGSHTCLDILATGWTPVVFDDFSNSKPESLKRVMALAGREFPVIEGDVRDTKAVVNALVRYDCKAVIHFAGLKAVGESNERPLDYYNVNVTGSQSLMYAMLEAGVSRLVFSSSATVYGQPEYLPLDEAHRLQATNPYGQTKLMIETIIKDVVASGAPLQAAILRYFNPVGAHESGDIGEDPVGPPNNLMPYIAQVAIGQRPELSVWGNDYDTPDGTGVRDYIHVSDLARAHTCALEKLFADPATFTVNLGTGQGYSVLQVIKAFAAASERDIPYTIKPRRAGDIASCYADPSHAEALLGWKAKRGMAEMCKDHWHWQSNNPEGFPD